MKLLVLAAAGAVFLCAQAPRQLPITSDLPPDTVIAKSGDGKTITAGEIRTLIDSGDPAILSMAKQSPEQFLVNVFVLRYLASEGEKAHIADESPLKEQLQYLRDKIISTSMVNRIRETQNVPEEAITDFYAHNTARYEQAWIKVIVLGFCPTINATPGTSDEDLKRIAADAVAAAHCKFKRTEEEAHDAAVGLVGRIRGGADFAKLVDEYSEDPDSKATQGDFGLVTRDGSYKPEIKAAVFSLGNGEVSDPIRSGTYFYIIKIKEKSVQPLANVREPIVQELKQKRFTDWLDELTRRFKPAIVRPDFFTPSAAPKPGGPPQLVPKP